MTTNTLPTDDLKKFGIIDSDDTFSKKLSAEEIQKFLSGATIVADNNNRRITFQLTENNSKLNVNIFERQQDLSDILKNAKNTIEFNDIIDISKPTNQYNFEKKAYVFDDKLNKVIEYDVIKNTKELTQTILDKNNPELTNRYKYELIKLKELLLEKIDQYPEIAKDITNDLNIVSNEINSVNSISPDAKQLGKDQKRDIQLDVNDPDMYQDANRHREEESEEEQDIRKSRGFKR
ncbi:TPA: hypothetical protein ACGZ9U_003553 [Elizabethkingia anophelis]